MGLVVLISLARSTQFAKFRYAEILGCRPNDFLPVKLPDFPP